MPTPRIPAAQARGRVDIREATNLEITAYGVKVRIDGGQDQDRPTSRSGSMGSRSGLPPVDDNRWGQGQDRPTSRPQPDGVKARIDPPQGHNPMGSRPGSTHLKVTTRWGQGQDRPTSRSQPMGSRSGLPPVDDNRLMPRRRQSIAHRLWRSESRQSFKPLTFSGSACPSRLQACRSWLSAHLNRLPASSGRLHNASNSRLHTHLNRLQASTGRLRARPNRHQCR